MSQYQFLIILKVVLVPGETTLIRFQYCLILILILPQFACFVSPCRVLKSKTSFSYIYLLGKFCSLFVRLLFKVWFSSRSDPECEDSNLCKGLCCGVINPISSLNPPRPQSCNLSFHLSVTSEVN